MIIKKEELLFFAIGCLIILLAIVIADLRCVSDDVIEFVLMSLVGVMFLLMSIVATFMRAGKKWKEKKSFML